MSRPTAEPSPEELAAIMAAVELTWPRPAPPAVDEEALAHPWRFSGRWWARPVTARRDRLGSTAASSLRATSRLVLVFVVDPGDVMAQIGRGDQDLPEGGTGDAPPSRRHFAAGA